MDTTMVTMAGKSIIRMIRIISAKTTTITNNSPSPLRGVSIGSIMREKQTDMTDKRSGHPANTTMTTTIAAMVKTTVHMTTAGAMIDTMSDEKSTGSRTTTNEVPGTPSKTIPSSAAAAAASRGIGAWTMTFSATFQTGVSASNFDGENHSIARSLFSDYARNLRMTIGSSQPKVAEREGGGEAGGYLLYEP